MLVWTVSRLGPSHRLQLLLWKMEGLRGLGQLTPTEFPSAGLGSYSSSQVACLCLQGPRGEEREDRARTALPAVQQQEEEEAPAQGRKDSRKSHGPEYKECFSLYDKQQRGKIKATDLLVSMRCLGASPTPGEVQRHLQTHGIDKNGELDFSTFLTIMHMQIKQEDPKKEILLAMLMTDKEKKGYIMASELRSKLMKLGEKLTHKEVDELFKEAGIEPNGQVKYDTFIQRITLPVRDY